MDTVMNVMSYLMWQLTFTWENFLFLMLILTLKKYGVIQVTGYVYHPKLNRRVIAWLESQQSDDPYVMERF